MQLMGFLLIKLSEQTDLSLTFPSGVLLVDLRLTTACSHLAGFILLHPYHLLWPLPIQPWVKSNLCSSHPKLHAHYQNLLCWPRLRSSTFQAKDRQLTHSSTFCTFLWPSRPGLHVLTNQTQRQMSLEENTVHCLFPTQQQGCSTDCGKPCSASLWLPSALVLGVLHCTVFCTAAQIQRERKACPCTQLGEQGIEKLFISFSLLHGQML